MKKVKELLVGFDFTMDEFWSAIDALPDEIDGRKHKMNIRAFFKKDGTPKSKALSLSTDNDFQTWHTTQGFIRRQIRVQIHMNRLKQRRDVILKNIRDVKEGKDVPRMVTKEGKLGEPKKKKDKENG